MKDATGIYMIFFGVYLVIWEIRNADISPDRSAKRFRRRREKG